VSWLIPQPQEFVSAAWTALFVVVLSTAVLKVMSQKLSPEDLLGHAQKDIGEELWTEIRSISAKYSCDPAFIRAIVAGEVLQRPRWLRSIEKIKGIVFRRKSYGVAQVSSDSPLSDKESIIRLCQNYAGYYPKAELADHERIRAKVEMHNLDDEFTKPCLSSTKHKTAALEQ